MEDFPDFVDFLQNERNVKTNAHDKDKLSLAF